MSKDPMKEPPTWMLGVGLTLILAGLVLLMFIPANSWGF
jgi:hypothetical protein